MSNIISNKRIFGLDLLRATAIVLVVFSHCIWFFPNVQGVAFTVINYAGLFGVEIFFVLSGFLIGRILYRMFVFEDFSFNSLIKFWKRRWFRTLPNYFLILIINVILAIALYHDLPNDIWKYFFFVQNLSSEQDPFFYESWSLSIEEYAYLIGPLVLFLSRYIFPNISRKRMFIGMIIIVVTIFIGTKIQYHITSANDSMILWTTNLKSVVIYRIDAIYYGFIAAYVFMNHNKIWNDNKNFMLSISILIFVCFNTYVSFFAESNGLIWNVFYLPVNSIAIALSIPFFSNYKSDKGLFFKAITFLSVSSYSMYLIHYTVVLKFLKFYALPVQTPLEIVAAVIVYLIVTLLLSYGLFRYFEKPIMNLQFYDKSAQ